MRINPFQLATSVAVFLASSMVFTIGVSLFEVVIGRVLGCAILLAAVALSVMVARRISQPEPSEVPTHRVMRWVALAVAGFAALVWLATFVPAVSKPDLSWDGNSYHIPAIHQWALRGYVHWITPDPPASWHWGNTIDSLFNGYPKGLEVIAFVLTRATGSSHLVNAVNLLFIPAGALGVASIARRLGASGPSSAIAGSLFTFVPVVVTQANTTYVDAALGASVAVVAAAALEATADVLDGRSPMRTVPALGAGIGLALSIKASGLALGFLPLILLAVVMLAHDRKAWRQHARFMVAALAVTAVVAGYFYVRNVWHKGNPIYPVQVTLLGREILPGVPLREQITEGGVTPAFMQGWADWRKVAVTWSQGYTRDLWPDSIRYFDAREGGLGFLWLLGGLPAALALAVGHAGRLKRGGSEDRRAAVVFFVLFFHIAIGFVLAPLHWWARYTVWLHVLGLPAVAVALDALTRRGVVRALTLGWAVCLGWIATYELGKSWMWSNLIPFFVAPYTPPESVGDFVRRSTTYQEPNFLYGVGMPDLNKKAFASSSGFALGVLTVEGGPVAGLLSMPLGGRRVVYLNHEALRDEASFRAYCDAQGVRFVIWDEKLAPAPPVLEAAARKKERFQPLWTLFDVARSDEPLVPMRAK